MKAKTTFARLSRTTLISAMLLATGNLYAAGSDFANTDFAAAAPNTYDHATGGGAYNDRTTGDDHDITEQLEGYNFTCGDIVTYLTHIEIEESTVDPVQTAEFDFRFLGNSTGQRGAGQVGIVNVAINYGDVENGDNRSGSNGGAGSYGLDSGISDDGGSTATLVSETFVGTPFQPKSELLGTVRVDDLEPGESTVLRIDVQLGCEAGTSPTGNLQGQLDGARVVAGTTGTISTGQQTIPFLKVGEIMGAGEPLLRIDKKVVAADGNCESDSEVVEAYTTDTVKYCYTISNPGTADLYDVQLTDNNGTPDDTSDDFNIALSGLADLDGEADLGDLGGTLTATGETLAEMPSSEGSVDSTVTVSGNNGLSGGNSLELAATDTTTVAVSVSPNNPPIAAGDSYSTPEGTVLEVSTPGVLANDSDLDGDALYVSVDTEPVNGTLMLYPDGSFTYTPGVGFTGTDSYTYEACDSDACSTATVTIEVSSTASAAVAAQEAPVAYSLSEFVGSAAEAWPGFPSDVSQGANDTRGGSIEINTIGEHTRFSEEKFVAGVVNLRNGKGAIVEQKQLERRWPPVLQEDGCNPTTAYHQCWAWKGDRTIKVSGGSTSVLASAMDSNSEVALMAPENSGGSSEGFDSSGARVTVSGGLISDFSGAVDADNSHQTMRVTWEVPPHRDLSETERRFQGHYDWECDGLEPGTGGDDPWVGLFYRSSRDSADDIHHAAVTVVEDTPTRLTIEVNVQQALEVVRDQYLALGKDLASGCGSTL